MRTTARHPGDARGSAMAPVRHKRRRRTAAWIWVALVVLAAGAIVAGTSSRAADPLADGTRTTHAPVGAQTSLAELATLEVKGRAPRTGFERDQFGQRWLDVDGNGCDTRNDILARDLTDVVRSGPCRVVSGTLVDPYTGATIEFVRGQATSALVQIDHVVSLSDAWQKGAQQLSAQQRASFANDPMNLLAVDGTANAQKGDGDAATWLPSSKQFRCAYVARQVSVKAAYGLWVTRAEHDAIARVLAGCPGEPAGHAVEPVAPARDEPDRRPGGSYESCDAVRAAGAAPILAGDPGYSLTLDRDGDGIGCE